MVYILQSFASIALAPCKGVLPDIGRANANDVDFVSCSDRHRGVGSAIGDSPGGRAVSDVVRPKVI
jgi:hypothetical protein